MFERFTGTAQRVIVRAQENARDLNHECIGTEHLLLGLIQEDEGTGAKSLEALGISLDSVRGKVEEIIGPGVRKPTGTIPFVERAKKVLELSLRESLLLGHTHIGSEHLLLGLIREEESIAAQVLTDHGAEIDQVRNKVIELLSSAPGREGYMFG